MAWDWRLQCSLSRMVNRGFFWRGAKTPNWRFDHPNLCFERWPPTLTKSSAGTSRYSVTTAPRFWQGRSERDREPFHKKRNKALVGCRSGTTPDFSHECGSFLSRFLRLSTVNEPSLFKYVRLIFHCLKNPTC